MTVVWLSAGRCLKWERQKVAKMHLPFDSLILRNIRWIIKYTIILKIDLRRLQQQQGEPGKSDKKWKKLHRSHNRGYIAKWFEKEMWLKKLMIIYWDMPTKKPYCKILIMQMHYPEWGAACKRRFSHVRNKLFLQSQAANNDFPLLWTSTIRLNTCTK